MLDKIHIASRPTSPQITDFCDFEDRLNSDRLTIPKAGTEVLHLGHIRDVSYAEVIDSLKAADTAAVTLYRPVDYRLLEALARLNLTLPSFELSPGRGVGSKLESEVGELYKTRGLRFKVKTALAEEFVDVREWFAGLVGTERIFSRSVHYKFTSDSDLRCQIGYQRHVDSYTLGYAYALLGNGPSGSDPTPQLHLVVFKGTGLRSERDLVTAWRDMNVEEGHILAGNHPYFNRENAWSHAAGGREIGTQRLLFQGKTFYQPKGMGLKRHIQYSFPRV